MTGWFYYFEACNKSEHHGGEHVSEQSYLLHGGWEAKEREKNYS
jgi:hypothetical protein